MHLLTVFILSYILDWKYCAQYIWPKYMKLVFCHVELFTFIIRKGYQKSVAFHWRKNGIQVWNNMKVSKWLNQQFPGYILQINLEKCVVFFYVTDTPVLQSICFRCQSSTCPICLAHMWYWRKPTARRNPFKKYPEDVQPSYLQCPWIILRNCPCDFDMFIITLHTRYASPE